MSPPSHTAPHTDEPTKPTKMRVETSDPAVALSDYSKSLYTYTLGLLKELNTQRSARVLGSASSKAATAAARERVASDLARRPVSG